jgi:hypothetical protein
MEVSSRGAFAMGSSSTILPVPPSDSDVILPGVNGSPDQSLPESDNSIRLCANCLAEITRDDRVCPHCGKAIPEL